MPCMVIPGSYTFTEVCVRFTMVVNSCATIITHLHPAVMSLVISYSQDFTSMLSSCLQLPYTRSTNTWDGGPLSWPIWVFNMRSKLSQNQVQATYLCRVYFQESSTLVSIATCSLKCILTSDRGYPWLPFVQLVMLLRDYRDHFDPASCSTPQTLGIKERSDASITASQVTPSHTASGGHSLNRPHTSTPFHA